MSGEQIPRLALGTWIRTRIPPFITCTNEHRESRIFDEIRIGAGEQTAIKDRSAIRDHLAAVPAVTAEANSIRSIIHAVESSGFANWMRLLGPNRTACYAEGGK